MNDAYYSLVRLLEVDEPLEVVDIGANPIDGAPPYHALLQDGAARLTGFEPQPDALAKLLLAKGEYERYLPYAVGDGKAHELRVCAGSGMTSLLEPDVQVLSHFQVLVPLAEVVQRIEIDTQRLDDISEIERIDFLKMDIQGFEYEVFKGGSRALKECVVVQVEVSFTPLYVNQPAFGEIDIELRRQGFIPHCFAALKNWPIAPLVVNNNPMQPLNQLLEADMVYVRDFIHPDGLSDTQLKRMALIAHLCYGSFDLACRCVHILVERGSLKAGSVDWYLELLATA